MSRCAVCLLPSEVPGSDLNKSGVCHFCRNYDPNIEEIQETQRLKYEQDLEKTLAETRGAKSYDALVCLSGGKDSIYLLYRAAKKCGLRVLAFTVDANIPDVAWASIRKTVEVLQVDHLVYRPPVDFYRKLFHYLLRNQESRGAVYTISYVYGPLFEGDALTIAHEKGIPLVLAGYSPGQPDRERMEYEYSRKLICDTDWTPPGLRDARVLSEVELARFWNPGRYPPGTQFPRYLAPFHAWKYHQGEIMQKIVALGLVPHKSNADPVLSNYPVNWLLMYSDLKNFGYNPYAPEFASLIRSGKASRRDWAIKMLLVDYVIRKRVGGWGNLRLGRIVTEQMKWLGLRPDDLIINKPFGWYDPKR
jgi:hypothetical protein